MKIKVSTSASPAVTLEQELRDLFQALESNDEMDVRDSYLSGRVKRVNTFSEVGVMTGSKGIQFEFMGKKVQLTIAV